MTTKTVAANRSARAFSDALRRKLDEKARVLPIPHAFIETSINHDRQLTTVRPELVEGLRQAQPERCGVVNYENINNEESGAGENLPDSVKGALHALQRAAIRARQVAQQTGTDLIVVRSGQVVRVSPQEKTTP